MTDKILVWEAKDKKYAFQKSVESVRDQANGLIQTFHKYQKFQMIKTRDEFEKLCYRPGEFFDEIIQANIKMPKNSGLQVNIDKLCELYSIDRPLYRHELGLTEINDDCPECNPNKPKVKGSGTYLLWELYSNFTEFLTFDQGRFSLIPEQIESELDKWNFYATTPAQMELYKNFETLANSLNTLFEKGVTGPSNLEQVSKLFPGLKFFNNSLSLNPEVLRSLIFKIQ